MESYIKIDSISIDLANSIEKSTDAEKCDHFSIRGYVSEIREKDWKICWPFPLQDNHSESEEQPSVLPPLDVLSFRWWCCQNCRRETAAEGTDNDDQTGFNCFSSGCRSNSNCIITALRSDNQQALTPVITHEGREIDLNSSIDLSCGSDHLPINDEKETKVEIAHSRMIDLEIGLGNNLNNQITSVSSPEVHPAGLRQEVPANDRGCEGNEVTIVELGATNPKCMAKSSAENYTGGTPVSADDKCQKELRKECTVLGEGAKTVAEADNIADQRTEHPTPESVACRYAEPGSTYILAENDYQDHHLEKSTGLHRRKPRKVRLLCDLLSENVETKTEHIRKQESPSGGTSNASAALQLPSISQGKVDVQGDLKNKSQSIRKRKFVLDEESITAETCSQRVENDVQILEGNAEAIDTALDAGSKDVLAGIGLQDTMKSCWSKPGNERSHKMGKKKNKKVQVLDNYWISDPYQGQQNENQDNMDGVDKVYASKTLSTKLVPHALTEKEMDNFPLHALRTENDSILSKGKGKMLQVDRELPLFCQKNNMFVEDSYAYTGAKIKSNMPASVSIPSAQGAINENGPHLSLNSILASQVYNKKCIHQTESRSPFSLPLQEEGPSKVHQLLRRDRDTDFVGVSSIHSKHMRDAISGKGVCFEEITGARNTGKTAEALEQVGIMKKYGDQTADKVSEQGTVDDIPMEIVELMAKNQYERCLPDTEIRNHLLEKSTIRRKPQMTVDTGELRLLQESQKEKSQGRHGKNSMVSRGKDVRPSKRKSAHYSAFDGNHLNMNSLNQPHSTFGVEVLQSFNKPSSGFHFSHSGSSQPGSAQNCKFNGGTTERGSFNGTLQARGGCSLHKTILQQDDEASRIWASLTPNHMPLGYDIPKKVVSQSTSNMDMNSLRSGTLHKQNMKRDIDLYMNLNAADLGNLSRNMDPGTFSRMTTEYPFPCKHSGVESHQNLRRPLDLYSNETIPAMHLLSLMDAGMQSGTPFSSGVSAQMLKRPSYPGDCSTKLDIGTSSKVLGSLKRPSSDHYSKGYSHGCFLGSSTITPSSSILHDGNFVRTTDFNSQISSKSGRKDKMKSSNTAMQNNGSKHINWPGIGRESPHDKLEVHGTCGTLMPVKNSSRSITCSINRNPADFTMPERGNVYMISGEDLKFEKASVPQNRPGLLALPRCQQQKNLKRTKIKEHTKH